jgi:nitroreductase
MEERLRFLLRYAILAPSSHNTQPWRFRIRNSTVDLFADKTRWLRVADSDQRELHISLGCAVENLLVAAEHFQLTHQVDLLSQQEQDHCATVSFTLDSESSSSRPAALFDAITERSTSHSAFEDRTVETEVLRQMEGLCFEPELQLLFTDDQTTKRHVDELVVRADALQFADPDYREELGYWLGQGVFGQSWLMSKIGQLAVTYVNMSKKIARDDSKLLMSAPILGAITSKQDDRVSQIRSGMVYERVALMAASHGLAIQPMSQILELAELRAELAELMPDPDMVPQHTFRLGFAEPESAKSPRRPLSEVLI